jgi:hypothetical protein
VIIRAYSVFEHVIYHCALIDPTHPGRPVLEVEAVVRDGDIDDGPLLLALPEYVLMAGGPAAAAPHVRRFRAAGRLADHLGVAHLTFPIWTPRHLDRPAPAGSREPRGAGG